MNGVKRNGLKVNAGEFLRCQTKAGAALGANNDSFVSIETPNAAVQHFTFVTMRFCGKKWVEIQSNPIGPLSLGH
ncbi:hypothetical protein [Sphingorhabdus sp. 109]|jgi:hypothetical protein|uniref:hypothetical protein n=1 Tax=Sphingorhabdus sp. 109 TaxID=2653173 RepID=UPI0012F178B7|nr:hypothetical protein [Sphingorhabdus sp. 109]VWX60442.1 hypothetical protein SPHINGOR109_50475 [Sphingorhabdus sp. 109]